MKRIIHTSLIALMAASAFAAPAFAKAKTKPAPTSLQNVMVGAAPMRNVTPVENGFVCFSKYLASDPRQPVFTVGRLTDQSGKFSNEASAGGFAVTQGLAAMAYTAYGKMGIGRNVVERTDMSVTESDMAIMDRAKDGNGNQLLLGDAQSDRKIGQNGLRNLTAGQFAGADYYVTGGITEVNYNIDSGGAEIGVQGIGIGKRTYTMSVSMDLRMIDAKTLRMVGYANPVKKYVGYETKAGVFNFLGDYLIDINTGKKAQEPLQLGVRATMESAMIELVSAVYGPDAAAYGKSCSLYAAQNYGNIVPVGTSSDPIGDVVLSTTK